MQGNCEWDKAVEQALKVINTLKEEGLIKEYAIGGGIATIFYAEPFLTYDLDVFITLPETDSDLVVLTPIYDYLRSQGYKTEKEHILIGDMPMQFFVPGDGLEEAAVRDAVELEYEGVRTRVMRAEYLIAIFLRAHRAKDVSKISALVSQADPDMDCLSEILKANGLWDRWVEFRSEYA